MGAGISIHAPREGCDSAPVSPCHATPRFQSTHPARGATLGGNQRALSCRISIHAPREGCDGQHRGGHIRGYEDFNPRTPRGVRLRREGGHAGAGDFNPRTPRGVRLGMTDDDGCTWQISIHAPREGCDYLVDGLLHITGISIHAPREGCDGGRHHRSARLLISIHAPREGCDSPRVLRCAVGAISIHAPREGCDPSITRIRVRFLTFQSTHPARGATANFTKEQRVCLAQFAYLHKGKKAEHTKTNAPMLH